MTGDGLTPEILGLRSALRLKAIDLAVERVARFRAERDAASLRLQLAEMEHELALWASETGNKDFGFNARSFREWLRKGETT